MSAVTLPGRTQTLADRSVAVRRWALLALTAIVTLMRTGAYWDVQWHSTVGRDSFWIPPHDLLYSGVAFAGLLGLWFTWRDGIGRAPGRAWPWGWTLSMLGAGMLVSAAPFDELWHRLYGIDVTIWSPPHMAGVFGGLAIAWGLVVLWNAELHGGTGRPGRRNRGALRGLVWAGTLVVSFSNFALVPAVRWSVTQPVLPTLYAALGSLLIPLPLLAIGLLTRRWWAPLAIIGGILLLRLLDQPLYLFSTAYIVPLFRQFPRSDGRWIYIHLWFHVLLNLAPALGATAAVLLRGRVRPLAAGVAGGALSGMLILAAILVLRSGALLPVNRYTGAGGAARDFAAEVGPFLPLLGSSTGLALLWAVVFGALGGVVAVLIAGRIGQKDAGTN